ncbi:MAG: PEP-CTERM sorting domain-containing protein [Verrucomicrobiota bacterium]
MNKNNLILKSSLHLAIFALAIVFGINNANAALNILITDIGEEETRWQFSGSTEITIGEAEQNELNGFWFVADMWSASAVSDTFTSNISGSWEPVVNPESVFTLNDVYVDNSDPLLFSGVGFRTTPTPDFGIGDTISWSGDIVVDISGSWLKQGSYNNGYIGRGEDRLTLAEPFTIEVIPEPSWTVLIAIVGVFSILRRKTRR